MTTMTSFQSLSWLLFGITTVVVHSFTPLTVPSLSSSTSSSSQVSSFGPAVGGGLVKFPTRTDNVHETGCHTTTKNTQISNRRHAGSTRLHGIPKMFRWLTDEYPQINRQIAEGLNSNNAPPVDCFYLDMNGIIHPATHGNAKDAIIVLDESVMFQKIFGYIDRLYRLVKPRRLLYLAVDGVAPRAKMNQQRSRRFRAATEAEETAALVLARTGSLPPRSERFDSNCITPGTDFMLKLSMAMERWIEYKMETDEMWANGCDVVFSGPNVPGEGEHKVMDYIREVKAEYENDPSTENDENPPQKGRKFATTKETRPFAYKPNLVHVLYGLDADLIMLGLVTREPYFMLLREKMSVAMAGRQRGGRGRKQKKKDMLEYEAHDFELLDLSLFRECFRSRFRRLLDDEDYDYKGLGGGGAKKAVKKGKTEKQKFSEIYDVNRMVDDFIFMCMLVGNDFLPHMPHLEINTGALTFMLDKYTGLLLEWGGYLTDKEQIHPDRFEQFLHELSFLESEHFKRRSFEEDEIGWRLDDDEADLGVSAPATEGKGEARPGYYGTWYGGVPTPEGAKAANTRSDIGKDGNEGDNTKDHTQEDTAEPALPFDVDSIRSYRDFYYATKMGWAPTSEAKTGAERDETLSNRRAHVRDYLEGLHWVLNYYHNGCPSWGWYFPHLYSPLCTDMVNLREFYQDADGNDTEEGKKSVQEKGNDDDDDGFRSFPFEKTPPFPSLGQLLSVLPPQSADLLPPPLAELMIEPSSPIAEYYPREFDSDPNGKRQSWEHVVCIPFIDGDKLLDVVNSVLDDKGPDGNGVGGALTKGERMRNQAGKTLTFVPKSGIKS